MRLKIKKVKELFVGKKALQPIFEKLHKVSLRGMNYEVGGITDKSGEKQALLFVKKN